jgi:hypothetical protein
MIRLSRTRVTNLMGFIHDDHVWPPSVEDITRDWCPSSITLNRIPFTVVHLLIVDDEESDLANVLIWQVDLQLLFPYPYNREWAHDEDTLHPELQMEHADPVNSCLSLTTPHRHEEGYTFVAPQSMLESLDLMLVGACLEPVTSTTIQE